VDVAKKELAQTDALIDVGKLAKTERAAAVAQVSVFQGNLIDAKAKLVQTRLALLRLINPQGSNLWVRDIVPLNPPIAPDVTLSDEDREEHVKVGLKMRPDLNQARLAVQNGDLQLVKTRNGLLPQLDLFMTLGKSGYSDSFSGTFKEMASRGSYDVLGGVSFSYPPGNRGPEAVNRQAMLTRDQSAQAVENMAQLVQVDVRSAYEELVRTRKQVAATADTRVAQQVAWETEKAKLEQGKSTSLLVAQAEQNLLTAQINEIQAVTNYLNAFVSLFRLEGSLLERMGVKAPVPEPVPSNEGKAQ
jgi:outer membrane protein TolC